MPRSGCAPTRQRQRQRQCPPRRVKVMVCAEGAPGSKPGTWNAVRVQLGAEGGITQRQVVDAVSTVPAFAGCNFAAPPFKFPAPSQGCRVQLTSADALTVYARQRGAKVCIERAPLQPQQQQLLPPQGRGRGGRRDQQRDQPLTAASRQRQSQDQGAAWEAKVRCVWVVWCGW